MKFIPVLALLLLSGCSTFCVDNGAAAIDKPSQAPRFQIIQPRKFWIA